MKSINLPTRLPVAFGMAAALSICLSACAPAAIGARLAPVEKTAVVAPAAVKGAKGAIQSEVRFAYGYTDGSTSAEKSLCGDVAEAEPPNNENYSVVICQGATPLAYAALRAPEKELKNFQPDTATKRRLAEIAAAELTPSPQPLSQE